MSQFHALFIEKNEEDKVVPVYRKGVMDELSEGDVLIDVAYSSVNFKDALASIEKGGIIRHYPMIPGIDLSGTIRSSQSPNYQVGQKVLVTGYGTGVSHTGGFSELARIPSNWIVPLPKELSLKTAMMMGTAGFTAALAIQALEHQGLTDNPEANILVTGASGGVASIAIGMLHRLGYMNITALTRKKDIATSYFKKIGVNNLLSIEDITPEKVKPLAKQNFDYVIDTVGGQQLEVLLPQIAYGGSIALCGNAGGIPFTTTVLPFILRSVNLLGIDSVNVPYNKRVALWNRIATQMLPTNLETIIQEELSLKKLPIAFDNLLQGHMTGRYLVKTDN